MEKRSRLSCVVVLCATVRACVRAYGRIVRYTANKITTSRTLDRLNGMRFVRDFFFYYSTAPGCYHATNRNAVGIFLCLNCTFYFTAPNLVRKLRCNIYFFFFSKKSSRLLLGVFFFFCTCIVVCQ